MKRLIIALAGYLIYRWWSGGQDAPKSRPAQARRAGDRPRRQA